MIDFHEMKDVEFNTHTHSTVHTEVYTRSVHKDKVKQNKKGSWACHNDDVVGYIMIEIVVIHRNGLIA